MFWLIVREVCYDLLVDEVSEVGTDRRIPTYKTKSTIGSMPNRWGIDAQSYVVISNDFI